MVWLLSGIYPKKIDTIPAIPEVMEKGKIIDYRPFW
jgi:hypothetical protein